MASKSAATWGYGANSVRRIQDKGQRRDGANPTMRHQLLHLLPSFHLLLNRGTELCQGLRGHAYCSTSWPTEFEIGLSLPQDYGVIASVCKSLSSVSIASGKNGAQSELSHHVTIRTAPRQRRKIGDARCAIYHIVSSHFHKIEMFCIYVGLRIGIYCVT